MTFMLLKMILMTMLLMMMAMMFVNIMIMILKIILMIKMMIFKKLILLTSLMEGRERREARRLRTRKKYSSEEGMARARIMEGCRSEEGLVSTKD